MKIKPIQDQITFKSGYPTFNSGGHLSYNPDVFDNVYIGVRPSGILKLGEKIDYKA